MVDASIAGPWLFEDERHPLSERVLDEIEPGNMTLRVPALWPIELTNALAMAERRGRIEPQKVDRALRLIARLPVHIDPARPSPPHLLRLCRKHQRTAYDALYLDLALRERLPVATLDGGMRQACMEAGVELFDPS